MNDPSRSRSGLAPRGADAPAIVDARWQHGRHVFVVVSDHRLSGRFGVSRGGLPRRPRRRKPLRGLGLSTRLALNELPHRQQRRRPMNERNPRKMRPGQSNGYLEKDPDHWVTGAEPMTAAQASYLKTLCEGTGVAFVARLTKAEASKRIDALRTNTGHVLRRAG
jgi:DUF3072 family protein